MVLVFDVLLCDEVDFRLPYVNTQGHASMEEAVKELCATVGIELLDYGHYQVVRCGNQQSVRLRGKGWVTRSRRAMSAS